MSDEKKIVSMGYEPNNETTVRTEKTERSNSNQYNAGTKAKQMIHEVYNSAYNHRHIVDRFNAGTARDLDDEPKADGAPVVIVGSGPSLDDQIVHFRDWRGGIICTTSHALTFIRHGIEPTHIMALDPFSTWAELAGVDWSQTRAKLITHPGVWPDLIEHWPNEILLYRQNLGRPDSFYATTQRDMYTQRTGGRDMAEFKVIIRTEVTLFACSPPAQLFVADRLGYGTAVLAGVDFAYHSGKSRFTGYTVRRPARTASAGNAPNVDIPAEWETHEHLFEMPTEEEQERNPLIVTNNGLYTQRVHLYYRKNMMSAWRLSCKNLVTADEGSMTEVPHMPLEKIIEKQDKLPVKSRKWIIRTTERYLASVDAWVVCDENGGHNFVESANPKEDIKAFIDRLKRIYACTACGVVLQSGTYTCEHCGEDFEIESRTRYDFEYPCKHCGEYTRAIRSDHVGDKCPQCNAEKALVHKHDIDIEKNMRRIERLMAQRKT